MAGKKKEMTPPPPNALKVLTVAKMCLEDYDDLENLKEVLDSVENDQDPVFRGSDESERGAIIYVDWVFELKNADDLGSLNDYAAEVESSGWEFSLGDAD